MEHKNINSESEGIAINIGDMVSILWNKMHIILLMGVFTAILSFIGTEFFITPLFSSTTKIYVLSRQDTASVTVNDLATGTQLTKDYMELVKSRSVLEEVIEVLNLKMTTKKLSESITVSNPTDTRILSIVVLNENPKVARDIADTLREAVSTKITTVMDIDSVNTVEEASLALKSTSPNIVKNVILGGLLGIILTIGLTFLAFFYDDTIKKPDDVEHYLNINVLASLPIREETMGRKGKRRGGASNGRD